MNENEIKDLFGIKEYPPMTDLQRKALHLYFANLAEALNEAGLDMREVLRPEIEISWTSFSVKNYLWRAIQKSMFGKESTTELSTKEVNQIYEILHRHLAEKFHINVSFPSEADMHLIGQ